MTRPALAALVLLACGTAAPAQQPVPSHTEIWNITGRGPTLVQITNGQATIVGDAHAASPTPSVVPVQSVPTATTTVVQANYFSPTTPAVNSAGAADALDEVNMARARRGLPPFARDESLTVGAMGCAQARAARFMVGHTGNDFAFLPPGASCSSTGCAAWPASMGWGSCCTYEGYRFAGAAWAMGADGKRYMSLFVR
jgi:hypothetical protein